MITPALIGNFLTKYGGLVDSLPEIGSFAEMLPFKQQAKIGEKYSVSFLAGIEHGQTASRAGGLFDLNPAIGAEVPRAELDGSTIIMRAQYAWDDVYASLNGKDSSYQDVMSLKMKAKGMGGSLYRDLALAYGPGAGSVLASNIGVIKTNAAGALSTARDVFLTKQSYIRGLWPSMRNALVDIYTSDLTTLRVADVTIRGNPNVTKTLVRMYKAGSAITPQAGDVIVPKGWRQNSCIGFEAIMNTSSGPLWGIADVAEYSQFRTPVFSASNGPLSLQLIREWCALIADSGSKQGGTFKVAGSAFAALANEYSGKNRDTSSGGVKKQGETGLLFDTPAGLVKVETWDLAKQGQGMYVANSSGAYRVGTTDNTMRPIKGLNEGFLTALTEKAGCQSMMYSNQAPFCDNNWHNFLVTDIASPGDCAES